MYRWRNLRKSVFILQKQYYEIIVRQFFLVKVQVNNYEIIVKFTHISHNLRWYSAIVHKFTRIYPVCSTYELPKHPGLKNPGVEKSGVEMSCNCQTLLQEPRGYPCQNLNFIFPSQNKEAAFGYVIAEQNCIYPLFSGHNTICVVTALLVSLRIL